MPYITVRQGPIYYQMTFEDILNGPVDVSKIFVSNNANTRTHYAKYLTQTFLEKFNINGMISLLESFNERCEALGLFAAERHSLYRKFFIPKKSGGLRPINAPNDTLMKALRDLKDIFEKDMFALYHTSAFAYAKERSTVLALARHQQNQSKWFLKLDFHDFFGSTTPEFLYRQLASIFPFSEVAKNPKGEVNLRKALSLCFLDGGLPQGTPISPMLTNLMMIPIDHVLSNILRDFEYVCSFNGNTHKRRFVYTRYADDMIISSRDYFEFKKVIELIKTTLLSFNAPFELNEKKTRYGSSSGSNWNLGLMLNRENNITVGHVKKRTFKAMCNNYICDKKNGKDWPLEDVQSFDGTRSYYKKIEPETVGYIINHYNNKYGVDLEKMIREDLMK